jgi:hypothetical protein
MSHDVTNFLPPDRKHAFTRNYFIRLVTILVILATIAVVVHAVLLVPTYLYVSNIHTQAKTQLTSLSQHVPGGDADASTRLERLEQDATRLLASGTQSSSSMLMQKFLAVPHEGVALQSFTVDVGGAQANSMKARFSGVSSSREALRSFHSRLSALSFVVSADLPLSVYAKDKDIPFSIDVTGTITP